MGYSSLVVPTLLLQSRDFIIDFHIKIISNPYVYDGDSEDGNIPNMPAELQRREGILLHDNDTFSIFIL